MLLEGLDQVFSDLPRVEQRVFLVRLLRKYFTTGTSTIVEELKHLLRLCTPEEQKSLPSTLLRCFHGEDLSREIRLNREDGSTYCFCVPPELRHQRALTPERAAELRQRLERAGQS